MSVSSHTATQLTNKVNKRGSVLLGTPILGVFNSERRAMTLRTLVDQESERSFIPEAAAQQLRLARGSINTSIIGTGGHTPGHVKHSSLVVVNPNDIPLTNY